MRAPKKQPDRIQVTQFHLTFAALYPGELTHDSIQHVIEGWAANRGGAREWQSAREDHDAPADPERGEHFHVYVHFKDRVELVNRRTTKVFDISGRGGRTLHTRRSRQRRASGARSR